MGEMMGRRKWCSTCNKWYEGKFKTCCNNCFKWKKAENRLCMNCHNPDCRTPEFYPHAIDHRRKKKDKVFKMNPDWDFRGLTIEDMEYQSPSEPELNYWEE